MSAYDANRCSSVKLQVTAAISVPGPEITGLCISPDQRRVLARKAAQFHPSLSQAGTSLLRSDQRLLCTERRCQRENAIRSAIHVSELSQKVSPTSQAEPFHRVQGHPCKTKTWTKTQYINNTASDSVRRAHGNSEPLLAKGQAWRKSAVCQSVQLHRCSLRFPYPTNKPCTTLNSPTSVVKLERRSDRRQ